MAVPNPQDRLWQMAMAADVPAYCYGDCGLDALAGQTVDLILCAHAFVFVPATSAIKARYCIGYHPSLLPLHPGRHAVAEACCGRRSCLRVARFIT